MTKSDEGRREVLKATASEEQSTETDSPAPTVASFMALASLLPCSPHSSAVDSSVADEWQQCSPLRSHVTRAEAQTGTRDYPISCSPLPSCAEAEGEQEIRIAKCLVPVSSTLSP